MVGALATMLLASAATAAGATAPDSSAAQSVVALLNQQRAANGIPPITAINNSYASAWCPNEDNGPAGGESMRVLAANWSPETFSADWSPWTNAPLHQWEMYYPRVQTAGWAVMQDAPFNAGAVYPYLECMGFGNLSSEPSTPKAYTYFAEQGPGAVPANITVDNEGPFAPQQLVGIAQGTATGPQPILYVLGVGAIHARSWSLRDAAGTPVPNVQMVTSDQAKAAGYGAFFWDGAMMIPPPLTPGTVYKGQATFTSDAGDCIAETFSFATLRADGSRTGASLTPTSVAPCPGTTWGSAGPSADSAAIPAAAAAVPSALQAPRAAASWSPRRGLVLRTTLRKGERLFVRQGKRTASTRRHSITLHWPYRNRVTVWTTAASGRRSTAALVHVKRG